MCGGGKAPKAAPAVEPMKNAEAATGAAQDSAARAQAMRRGLMGLYTRYQPAAGAEGGAAALAGKSDKLGG